MKRILYLPLGILFFLTFVVVALVSLPQVLYYWGREYVTGEGLEEILLDKFMDWFDDRNS